VRALVTGAAGLVGRHLVPRLREAGYEVAAHDRDLDVTDAGACEAALARIRPDLVVHLAAVSSVPDSSADPGLAYAVNFLGTRTLLCAAASAVPGARLLLVSSADAYGPADAGEPPFTETRPLRPVSAYARTKAAADRLGAAFAARGMSVVRARPFNHTGPGQSDTFVLSSFARQAVEIAAGLRPPVLGVGNLDSVRDFLDVADVVDAYLLLADPRLPIGAYNIASGRGVRIGDALAAILRHAGAAPEVRIESARLRPTERTVGDASRLRAASGWQPHIPLDETLARLVADWRARISAP
jgi:GDP-4-dehydro-6-deoxy-D-mannose reductase